MRSYLKILSVVLAVILMAGMAACSGSGGNPSQAAAPPESAPAPADGGAAEAKAEESAEGAITQKADLVGKRIGVQQGTTGDIYAEDEIENVTVERYNKGADAVMALKQGKIDAVVIDDQPAKVFVAQNDDIRLLDEPLTVEDYAICVSKDNPELTAAMNEAITALKADGTLQGLLDYYIGQVEGAKPYESPADADHSKGTLTMGTNAAFPPYEYWENERICGLDADFARAICDRMGYALEIEDMDFDSIIVAVQSGKVDFGAAGMTVTEDRLKNIDFTDSYCTGTQVIIVKK